VSNHPSVALVADSSEEVVEEFVVNAVPAANTELPEYFPLQKVKSGKSFLNAYTQFWRFMVEKGSESAFSSEHLLSRLLTWFNKMVHAPLRPLRHAGAFSAFLLCDLALVQLKEGTEQLARSKKQKESEVRSKSKDISTGVLQEDIKALGARVTTQEGLVKQIWSLVFTKCWNDKDPAIRQLCVEKFADWCLSTPRIFMESDRFRFLVWMLADASVHVRLAAGKAFIKLLGAQPLRHQLKTYCERLIGRFLSRVRESDEDVAVSGVDILRTLREHFGFDYVPSEVVDEVKRLISVDSPELRRAVGQFVLPEILQSASSSAHKSVKAAAQLRGQNVERITALLEFIEDSVAHVELPAYVVDAIWENKVDALLFQFQDMANMLSSHSKLSESRQLLLVRLIHAIIKQLILPLVHTGKHKSSRSSFRVEGPACKLPLIKQLLDRYTNSFYSLLPDLLSSHKADHEMLIPLLSLVKYLDMKSLGAKEDAKDVRSLRSLSSPCKHTLSSANCCILHALISPYGGVVSNQHRTPHLSPFVQDPSTPHPPSLLTLFSHSLSHTSHHMQFVTQLALALKSIFTSTTSLDVMSKVARACDHLLADPEFRFRRVVDTSLRNMFDDLLSTLKGFVGHFEEPGSSQKPKPKRRDSNLGSSSFIDGAAPGTAPLVLCLLRLEALTQYFSLASWDESTLETVSKVLETRNDGLLNVVGPRSSSSAALIVGRLVCGVLESVLVEGDTNTSRMSESENYDIGLLAAYDKASEEVSEEEEGSAAATPSKVGRRSPTTNQKTKKKTKKGVTPLANNKVFDALSIAKLPTESQMEDIARTVSRSIELLQPMLSRTVDDTDVSDLAPLAAFQALSHILLCFTPQLEETSLKPLAYHCTKELEEMMSRTFEAEMERSDPSNAAHQERLVDVFSQYFRLNYCGVLGTDDGSANLRRCAAQLLHENDAISHLASNMISLLKKDKVFETPAPLAQFFVNTLVYEFERESTLPDTPALQPEEKQNRIAKLAKRLATTLPNIQKNFTPTVSKLLLDKLIQQVLQQPASRADLLLSAPVPFISKLSPAAARELHSSLTRFTDSMVTGLGDEIEDAYQAIKRAIDARATGKKKTTTTTSTKTIRTSSARRRGLAGAEEEGDDDDERGMGRSDVNGEEEDDLVETLVKKRVANPTRAKNAATSSSATPTAPTARAKRAAPAARAKRTAKASSISVLRQGDDVLVDTEDSEMAHTDDEDSVHEPHPPAKSASKLKARASASAAPSRKRKSVEIDDEMHSEDEEEGREEEEEVEVPQSQTSVDMPLTDSDFLEPSGSRPKRPRSNRQSQASQSSAKRQSQEESSEEASAAHSDSDDLMEHTPVAKRRAIPPRAARK